jgi:hypothetical protein
VLHRIVAICASPCARDFFERVHVQDA